MTVFLQNRVKEKKKVRDAEIFKVNEASSDEGEDKCVFELKKSSF